MSVIQYLFIVAWYLEQFVELTMKIERFKREMAEYEVGDLVICEGDKDIYMFLGLGSWHGWGRFVRMSDGFTTQMVMLSCSSY